MRRTPPATHDEARPFSPGYIMSGRTWGEILAAGMSGGTFNKKSDHSSHQSLLSSRTGNRKGGRETSTDRRNELHSTPVQRRTDTSPLVRDHNVSTDWIALLGRGSPKQTSVLTVKLGESGRPAGIKRGLESPKICSNCIIGGAKRFG